LYYEARFGTFDSCIGLEEGGMRGVYHHNPD